MTSFTRAAVAVGFLLGGAIGGEGMEPKAAGSRFARQQGGVAKAPPAVPMAVSAAPGDVSALDSVEQALQHQGYLLINHSHNPENPWEQSLFQRSMQSPNGYQVLPVSTLSIVKVGPDGSATLLLPCPRDIMDQMHVASTVDVIPVKKNQKINPNDRTIEVVYSQGYQDTTIPYKNPDYHNPFIKITLKGPSTKGFLQIHAHHYVVMPTYNPVGPADVQLALGSRADTVQRAAQDAAALRYDTSVGQFNAKQGLLRGKGDCSVKAAILREKAKGLAEVVEGFSYRVPTGDSVAGGIHCLNVIFGEAGLLTVDARGGTGNYAGPQEKCVITAVGGDHFFPAFQTSDRYMPFRKPVLNAGYYIKAAPQGNDGLAFSAPGFGREAEALKQEAIPSDIQGYAALLFAERMKVYNQ